MGAERELKRALEINPNSESAHRMYSWYLFLADRHEEALAEARRALEINPLSPMAYAILGGAYYFARRYDEALAQWQTALQVEPNYLAHYNLSYAYREKGMYKEAIAEGLKAREMAGDAPGIIGHLANTYARAGQRAEAEKILQKLIEFSKRQRGTYEVAFVYAGLGEKDRAFEWLEEAYRVRDKGMTFLKVDPTLDPLRSDPRFRDLLSRMNFPE